MADDYFDTTSSQFGLLIEDAYNLEIEKNYMEAPLFSQIATKGPTRASMNSDTVVFTFIPDLPTVTTPLDEITDPESQTPPTPTRITVTFNDYGDWVKLTQRLQLSTFVPPDPEIVSRLTKQMVESLDLVAKATIDTGTHFIRSQASSVLTSTGARNTVATPLKGSTIDAAATILDENLVPPFGDMYVAYAHPRVLYDIRNEAGGSGWIAPQVYQNTQALYKGEVGSWMGIRFIRNKRATPFTGAGASSVDVYPTYVFGQDAIVELKKLPPRVFLTDKFSDPLQRKTGIAWKASLGYALFRDRNFVRIETAPTLAATLT